MKTILSILVGLLCTGAWAETPDEAAIRQRIDNALARAERAAPPAVPRLDALPVPAKTTANLDIEAVAEKMNEAIARQEMPFAQPTLLAFVSFSMPKGSFERLMADAERTGATLVLRSLVEGSLTKTVQRAHALIGTRRVAWVIDPDAFRRFDVVAVPTYVLIRAGTKQSDCGAAQCLAPNDYVKLAGDVPLGYALDRFETRAPEFRAEAESFIAKIGKGR